MQVLKKLVMIAVDRLTPRATLIAVSDEEARRRVAARGIRLY
jgi:hypothetical protein